MRERFPFRPFWTLFQPVRAPNDGGGEGGAPAVAADPADPAAPAASAVPKWYEGDGLTTDERRFLESKGLTGIEDPAEAASKLARYYRSAEQLIGDKNAMKGPAKDQPIGDWMKANAKTFGIPETAEGYKVDKPADWPKDLPWNDELDAKAQTLAFERGVPVELHKAYIGMVADYMKGTAADLDRQMETARGEMMAELQRDWGNQTDAKLTQAKQAMSHFAGEAGLPPEAIDGLMTTLKEKVGDAAAMKLFAAIGASMGEDRGVHLGKSSQFSMTPAEASAAMSAMSQPGGKLYEATKAQNRVLLAEAQQERERLARIAAGG